MQHPGPGNRSAAGLVDLAAGQRRKLLEPLGLVGGIKSVLALQVEQYKKFTATASPRSPGTLGITAKVLVGAWQG